MDQSLSATPDYLCCWSRGMPSFRGEVKGRAKFPRKIGIGMLYILGFLEQGCQKVGVPFFFVTPVTTH